MADYPRAFVRLPPADIATERIVARTLTAIVSGRQVHGWSPNRWAHWPDGTIHDISFRRCARSAHHGKSDAENPRADSTPTAPVGPWAATEEPR